MSDNLPAFLEYDSEQEEQNLVKLFEEKTGKTLYPAQDERLLISIIEYKAALLVNLFNEAARLNLTQFSRGQILDCIGEMFDTPRLQGSKGSDTLLITLNTTFNYDLTIPAGLEVLSKDEKYSFVTTSDLTISAGNTTGQVNIEAEENGEDVNVYSAGDVNILVKPVSYIESVANINGVSGGTGIEEDDAYIKRILLAPEKFTCAGSRQSYIYHTLSSDARIIDATAQSVQTPATVKIGNTTYTEDNGTITTPDFTVALNRKSGQFSFSLDHVDYVFKMPPDNTVNIYPLIENDVTGNDILQKVESLLNGEKVNPMTDNVVALAPSKVSKTITLTVTLNEDADLSTVSEQIISAIDEYKATMRKKLNAEIIPSQIVSKIGAIEGVYSVDTGSLTRQSADVNEFFDITFEVSICQ